MPIIDYTILQAANRFKFASGSVQDDALLFREVARGQVRVWNKKAILRFCSLHKSSTKEKHGRHDIVALPEELFPVY